MTPVAVIAMLDRQLAAHGEDVELQRLTGTQLIPFKATCRAFVRGYSATELIGGITQSDSRVILSPTDIDAAGWPGPEVPAGSTTTDIRVPRKNDKAVIAGKTRNIEAAVGLYMAGVLVRIEMRVTG
jgi:hypothetical protein